MKAPNNEGLHSVRVYGHACFTCLPACLQIQRYIIDNYTLAVSAHVAGLTAWCM
jgi:hypothetical protein